MSKPSGAWSHPSNTWKSKDDFRDARSQKKRRVESPYAAEGVSADGGRGAGGAGWCAGAADRAARGACEGGGAVGGRRRARRARRGVGNALAPNGVDVGR